MKKETLLLVLFGLIYGYSEIYSQNYGPELFINGNFGTFNDGVTGINTTVPLYPTVVAVAANASWADYIFQPPTQVFVNNGTTLQNISINPAVTIAPPLTSSQTGYTFGMNEPSYSTLYQFENGSGTNSGVQIPMAPLNDYYVIATSTQGMYNAPTVSSASWPIVYDKYETNPAHPSNYFLIVHTGKNTAHIFYTQKIKMKRGNVYRMSADLCRLNITGSPPSIGFKFLAATGNDAADITTLGSTAATYSTGNMTQGAGTWGTYTYDYHATCSGGTTIGNPADSVMIWVAFANVASGNGNNIALDNLSFKEVLFETIMSVSGTSAPFTVTLTPNYDTQAVAGGYTFAWLYGGTPPTTPGATVVNGTVTTTYGNITASINATTHVLTLTGVTDMRQVNGFYYTFTGSGGSATCTALSPPIDITPPGGGGGGTVTTPPKIIANPDRVQAVPGSVNMPYNIITGYDARLGSTTTGMDCNNDTINGVYVCSPTLLQVLNFTITAAGHGINASSAGTFTPGIPVVLNDSVGNLLGVLNIDNAGDLTFTMSPTYPTPGQGGLSTFTFSYTAINTATGATASALVTIVMTVLEYIAEATCAGYPVRIVFTVPQFLPNDFYYTLTEAQSLGLVSGNPGYPDGSGTGGVNVSPPLSFPTASTADPSMVYVNDAVATRYYLVDFTYIQAGESTQISETGSLPFGANGIREVHVARTNNYHDGGKIIFEFIERIPGMHSYQLRKKEINANPSYADPGYQGAAFPQDPILQKAVVNVCSATAIWVGQSSTQWKDPNNWSTEGIGTDFPVCCSDVFIPSPEQVIYADTVGATPVIQTIANYPILQTGDACRDIIFKMGASVGKIQNLTYRAAYVEYTPPEIAPSSPQTLQSIDNSSGKWTMISVPLKYVYSADFQPDANWGANAFTDIKSYMSYFDLSYATNGITNPDGVSGTSLGSFSRPFANLKEPLPAGFGFASRPVVITDAAGNPTGSVFVETDSCKTQPYTFYFPRYINFGDAKLFEIPNTTFGPSNMATGLYDEAQYAYHYTDNGEWVTAQTAPDSRYYPFTFDGMRGVQAIKNYDTIPMPYEGYAQYPWASTFYLDHDTVAYVLTARGTTAGAAGQWTTYLKSTTPAASWPPAAGVDGAVYNYQHATVTYFPDSLGTSPVTGLSMLNPISGRDGRFRFIYEEMSPTAFYNKFGINKQTQLDYQYNASAGTFTLPILSYILNGDGTLTPRASATGLTRIVGNPLMSHLDFDSLYYFNNTSIMPYYRLWDGTYFYTYIVTNTGATPAWEGMPDGSLTSAGDNTSPAAYRYIPPMQAFFVDVPTANENAPLSLNFNTVMSTAIPNANITQTIGTLTIPVNNELRSNRAANENLLKIRLKMKEVETVALLASLPKATDRYNPNEDVYKLFSYDKATPEIYTVADNTAIEINAVSQEGERKLIPMGIKTNQTGQFELLIEGADNFTAYEYVLLRDALEDKYYDLKEQNSFSFGKTSTENLEGRFYILLSQQQPITTGITETTSNDNDNQVISIVRENDVIRVYSPVAAIDCFEAYDVSGRLLFKDTKISAYSYSWNPKLEQGVYLLKVHAGKYSKVQKIKW